MPSGSPGDLSSSADTLSVDIIADCVASGEFLSHPSTVRKHRAVYWQPRLFEHTSLHHWQQFGEPSVVDHAHRLVQEKLSRFDFELDPAKARELHRIYEHAAGRL